MGVPSTITSVPSVHRLVVDQQMEGSQFRLRFHLHVAPQGEAPSFEDHGSTVFYGDPAAHFRSIYGEIEAAKKGDKQLAQVRLSGLSIQLTERLLPKPLRERLWALQEKPSKGAGAPRLQLISNESAIPWELLKITGPNGGNVDSPFLVEAFTFTRWLTNVPGCLHLPLKSIALVIPRDSGLPSAESERQALLRHGSSQRKLTEVPAKAIQVLEAMASSQYDGWHYCGHGFAGDDNPDLWALHLEGKDFLKVVDISNARGLGRAKPLVFLNTCRSGQGAFALTNVGSWAKAFVEDAGAGAFLGTLWAVSDAPAAELAEVFYKNFLAGMPISEAMWAARQHIKTEFPGDPTWLAYSLFAAPDAICRPNPNFALLEEVVDVSSKKEEPVPSPVLDDQSVKEPGVPEPRSGRPATKSAAGFDVFLSYSSGDRAQVESIALKLENRGIRVYFDKWDLRPGSVWKSELQKALKVAPSAIVFVGRSMGPWHENETRVLLSQAAKRRIPIIPALLPINAGKPELPEFLAEHQWVELHKGALEAQDLERLIWGIGGEAPKELTSAGQTKPSGTHPWRTPILVSGLVIALLLVALGITQGWIPFSISPASSEKETEPTNPEPQTEPPADRRKSVAVLSFVNNSSNPSLAWLSTALPEVLSDKLGFGESIRVVSRKHVALSEIDLNLNLDYHTSLSREVLNRLYGLLGADYAIFGSFTSIGESTNVTVQVKLLDLRDGKELVSADETREEASWVELIDRVSGALPESQPNLRQFLKAKPLSVEEVTRFKSWFPRSLDAARVYATGLYHWQHLDIPNAERELRRAALLEPHPRILAALAETQYLLGQREQAKVTVLRAQERARQMALFAQRQLAFTKARIEQDKDAIQSSSAAIFRQPVADDLSRGIEYGVTLKKLGESDQMLLLVDELVSLPGADRHPEIPLMMARAYYLKGNLEKAAASSLQALERARALKAVRGEALALFELGSLATEQNDPAEAIKLFANAQLLFREVADRIQEAKCLELSALVAFKDNLPLAEDQIRQAIAVYESSSSQRSLTRSLLILSGIQMSLGSERAALATAERARILAEGLWFEDEDGDYFATSGYFLHLGGKLREARLQYSSAAAIYSRSGADDFYGMMLVNLGEIELLEGRFQDARNYFHKATALSSTSIASKAYNLFQLGRHAATTGDYVVAEHQYGAAIKMLEKAAEQILIGEIRIASAELEFSLGNFEKSSTLLTEVEQTLRSSNEQNLRTMADSLLVRSLLAQKRVQEAGAVAERLRQLEIEDFRAQYAKQIALAQFDASQGQNQKALSSLQRTAKEAKAAGHLLPELEIVLVRGQLELQYGEAEKGRELLTQLVAQAKSLGARQIQRRAEALLPSEVSFYFKTPAPSPYGTGFFDSTVTGVTISQALKSPDSNPSAKTRAGSNSGVDTRERLLSCCASSTPAGALMVAVFTMGPLGFGTTVEAA